MEKTRLTRKERIERAVNVLKEQTQERKYRKLIEEHLEYVALKLNGGLKINWKYDTIPKYFITYGFTGVPGLRLECSKKVINQGTIYCLSDEFLDVALREIGMEKLKFLLGVGG